MKTWIKENWLKVVAIVALLGAFGPFPFAYYQMMNWAVLGAALMTAYQAYKRQKKFLMWLFIIVAVVFNPITPFNLRADIWRIADVVVAVLILTSFFLIRQKKGFLMC